MAGENPKIALALGSGSAKGLAHIGVLQVLEEHNIPIAGVAGTSAGAFIGALWAAGLSGSALKEIALGIKWNSVARLFLPTLPRSGFVDGKRIQKFLSTFIHASLIEELKHPFACVATELRTGQEVIFDRGSILEAVRASISIPGIFVPVRHEERFLVDGGLVNPVPTSVAHRWKAAGVVAVNVIPRVEEKAQVLAFRRKKRGRRPRGKSAPELIQAALKKLEAPGATEDVLLEKMANILHRLREYENPVRPRTPGIFTVMIQSLTIAENLICQHRLQVDPPDVLIQPKVADVQLFEFNKAGRIIEAGRKAAEEKLAEIEKLFTKN